MAAIEELKKEVEKLSEEVSRLASENISLKNENFDRLKKNTDMEQMLKLEQEKRSIVKQKYKNFKLKIANLLIK